MHFDFIAEGWRPDLDEMEHWLHTRTFSMPITDAKGKTTIIPAPAALRPRRAYTYVFPREHLQSVINTLKPERCVSRHDGKGTPIGSMPAAFLRKGLRLKKFPDIDNKAPIFPLVKKNIRLIGLGYREDIDITVNKQTYEGL